MKAKCGGDQYADEKLPIADRILSLEQSWSGTHEEQKLDEKALPVIWWPLKRCQNYEETTGAARIYNNMASLKCC